MSDSAAADRVRSADMVHGVLTVASLAILALAGCSDGDPSPIGKSFTMKRTVFVTNCMTLSFPENVTIAVDVGAVTVGGKAARNVTVLDQGAQMIGGGGTPNIEFTIDEMASAGGSVTAPVEYGLFADGSKITGGATAAFQFMSTACSLAWDFVGSES